MSRRRGSPVHCSCAVCITLMGIIMPSTWHCFIALPMFGGCPPATVVLLARLPHEFYCVPPSRPERACMAYCIIGVRAVGSIRCIAKALERRLERLS